MSANDHQDDWPTMDAGAIEDWRYCDEHHHPGETNAMTDPLRARLRVFFPDIVRWCGQPMPADPPGATLINCPRCLLSGHVHAIAEVEAALRAAPADHEARANALRDAVCAILSAT